MLAVACVLRSGGIYDAGWVAKLQRGVARHLGLPHRFVCLSDVEVSCERIPLEQPWRGWWSKIELFRPGLFSGPVLYLDLDTIVVRSLDTIAGHPHGFTMAHEFYRPALKCSAAMAWNGDFSSIHRAFARDPARLAASYDGPMPGGRIGDQAFIEDCLRNHDVKVETFRDLFGERSIASYKVHDCRLAPPSDAAAVTFHGRPKPHEFSAGWVRDAWT